jgi:hypothetical protein
MNITNASRLNSTMKEGVSEQGAKEIAGITSTYDYDYQNKKDVASVAEEESVYYSGAGRK